MLEIEKKVNIYTLAEELGMTPSMVSRALSPNGKVNETKRRLVLAAAEKYSYVPNRMASRLSMKAIKIGIVINTDFKPIFNDLKKGIEAAYRELKDYKIEYELTELENVGDIDCARNAVRRLYGCDGIIISGLSADGMTDLVREIYENNKNLVQLQNLNPDTEYLFSSEHDMKLASDISAEFLHNCLRFSRRKNIVLFTGNLETYVHIEAKKAFLEAAREYGLDVIRCADMKDSESLLCELLPELLGDGRADGIYITSGFSLPLCRYVKEHRLGIPLVTFDVYRELNEYIKDGTVSATLFQNAALQAKTAFERLVYYIIDNEVPPHKILTSAQLVMKSNLSLYE